jgi:hypothetical protein
MAMFYHTQENMPRRSHSCEYMSFAMPAMGMFASAFIILQTGVLAPVSSFILALLSIILFVVLVVLISVLLLTSLTGLSRWYGLVRHNEKLATRYAQGD